jgi:DNA-binding NarL/FixJ family response regulator
MIVDDHELIRDGMRRLISQQPHLEVCGEAASESEASRKFRQLQPGMVIVDLALKDSSGLQLIEAILRERPDTKVIVSTMHDERDYGERVLRAGAIGYVNKQAPARTILTAIDRALEGKCFFSEALTDRIMHRAMSHNVSYERSPVASLSNRELEIFCLIGRGQTTNEIAAHLHLSVNTIRTYRERLKSKLKLRTSAELYHSATLWVAEEG